MKIDNELDDMLAGLEAGRENDLRARVADLEMKLSSIMAEPPPDPITLLGVDDNGNQYTESESINLQRSVGTANVFEINWWLPLTLADDDVTAIYCQVLRTISGVKYLYVGGNFTRIGGVTASNIARYSFATRQWEAVNGGVNGTVFTIAFSSTGTLHIGGQFQNAGGDAAADYIAKDNGGSWTNVNGGVNAEVRVIAFSSTGTLHIGGLFTNAGGDAAADYIAKDNGGSWANVNGGVNGTVLTIAFSSTDTLYIGGQFTNAGGDAAADYIAKDNGGSWTNVNGGGVNADVFAIAFSPNGILYIGGNFVNPVPNLAYDDNGSWSNSLFSISGTVITIAFSSTGTLYIGGQFQNAGGDAAADRIAYHDGMSWRPLTNGGGVSGLGGTVYSITVDSDTDSVFAAGNFDTAGTIKTACIAAFVRSLADALDMNAGMAEQYQARGDVKYPVIPVPIGDLSNGADKTSFTPVIEGTTAAGAGTYTTQIGYYVRMFNLVYFSIAFVWTAHTGTGNMQIGGLPFTAANLSLSYPCSVIWSNITLAAVGNKLLARVLNATTTIGLNEIGSGAIANLPLDTAGTLLISGFYFV